MLRGEIPQTQEMGRRWRPPPRKCVYPAPPKPTPLREERRERIRWAPLTATFGEMLRAKLSGR